MAGEAGFVIAHDGQSITCLTCGATSYHPQDVAQHYCGNCHVFHDDVARAAAISRIRERDDD